MALISQIDECISIKWITQYKLKKITNQILNPLSIAWEWMILWDPVLYKILIGPNSTLIN